MYAEGIVFRRDAQNIYDESSNYLENAHMTDELKQFFKDSDDPYEDGSDFMYVTGCSDYTYVTNIKKTSDYPTFTAEDIKNHFGLSDIQFELLVTRAHGDYIKENTVNKLDIIKKYSSKLEFLNEYMKDSEYSDISQLLCTYVCDYFNDLFDDITEFEEEIIDAINHISHTDELKEANDIVKLFVSELSEVVQ